MSTMKERNWLHTAVAILLSLMVAVCMIPLNTLTVHAETQADYPIDDCTLHLWYGPDGASVALQKYDGSATRLILPTEAVAEETTYKAGENGEFSLYATAFSNNNTIEMLEVPNGYEFIGAGAFKGCTSLQELTIVGSNIYLDYKNGVGVFTGCTATVYYLYETNLTQSQIEESGIATDANGSPIGGVTVWTIEGSEVDMALQAINESRNSSTAINIKYYNNHTWGDPVETIPATTSEAGMRTYTCTCDNDECNINRQVIHELIPKLPCVHQYGAWKKLNATQHQKVCGLCGDVKKANHTWDGGKVTKEPTATTAGVKTFTCTACKATKTQTIAAKTSYGQGATESAVNKAITKLKKDTDPKGTTFGLLQLKVKSVGKTSITLQWVAPKGAKKFVVYGNHCNASKKVYKYVKLKKMTGKSVKFSKINKTKIKSGNFYKFMVVALDKNNKVIATSKTVHISTKGKKAWNIKSVTISKKVITKAKSLKKGKTLKVNAKAVKDKKNKAKMHRAISYESSNPAIASVSSKGVITGKKAGTCYVYAYAQNGIFKKLTVKVK